VREEEEEVTRSRRLLPGALALAAVFLAAPAAAGAADRFASPTGGTAGGCPSGDPCSIDVAINAATTGDDVTLLPGTYTSNVGLGINCTPTCAVVGGITVHGSPAAPPVINMTNPSTDGQGIYVDNGSVLRDVIVNSTNDTTSLVGTYGGGTIERVISHESGFESQACVLGGGSTIRDSVCWMSGSDTINASAVTAGGQVDNDTATLRNVTAVTTGGDGVRLISSGSSHDITLTATNVIARGGGAAGNHDVATISNSPGGIQAAILDHSNYASESEASTGDVTTPGTGTNKTAAPAFVNAATGDFRETAASVGTLDLGTATGLLAGELDVAGLARTRGSAPDIGAYEFVPPDPLPTVTPPATTTPTLPTKKCKKGFVKKKIKGKKKCVKKKKKK
jgi:hypothetical protein